ncbi:MULTISPECIES: pyridoxal phosphate-dependent aminotransferase [Citricoccus]|uniref:pyridoxal phosphate-dependent aminotransferase n=1 Tax=Citricoccus TaxID=169133 RepID=UPI000255F4A5|nr:pyridoxal phosphate-dependent aminotransferase [Citricoccus sp. CH26A]
MTMHSATLAINETLQTKKAAGEKVLHLGFGEAGLPVPTDVLACLQEAAGRNSYGAVVGSEEARSAAAGWFTRREVPTSAEQIIFAPGSKALLFALLAVLEGDLVLPAPAWVSYAAQADMVDKALLRIPIPAEAGGVPDPALLEDALQGHIAAGGKPGILLLTIPDNPTGTVASPQAVADVCAVAERYGLVVICDEIYAEVCHTGKAPSALSYLPERTVVTSGLSKSMALGGWRIGFARVPGNDWGRELMDELIGAASEIWSSLAAPMQAVAAYVLSDPRPVTDYIARARALHARVAAAVHAVFAEAGATCRTPDAGFYLYPDFEPVRDRLDAKGISTGEQLADWLLLKHSVGILPGSAFGDETGGLRARVATSLLYGETEQQRWEALRSDDPVALPWIQEALEHLRVALSDLTA